MLHSFLSLRARQPKAAFAFAANNRPSADLLQVRGIILHAAAARCATAFHACRRLFERSAQFSAGT
jgi:hypothetical protein